MVKYSGAVRTNMCEINVRNQLTILTGDSQ